MRIAYVSSDFGVPVLGTDGSSVHVQETVRALCRLGHEVRVFSPNAEDGNVSAAHLSELTPVSPEGFAGEVGRLLALDLADRKHAVRELQRLIYSEYLQRSLLGVLEAYGPDVIYERYSLFSYGGSELARALDVPHVLEVNAPLAFEAATYRELVLRRTAEEMEQLILNAADAVVVVSRTLAEHALRLGVPGERVTVLPNAVDPERFDPTISGEGVRARYDLVGRSVVGFVGSLKPWHDIDTLLEAMRRLAEADDQVRILVVGNGPESARMRGPRTDFVTWTRAVEPSQVPEHLAAMDIVVVPYVRARDLYFSPMKLYEAMAMARPVVGARVGQVSEVLADGRTGVLYEPGNAGDLRHRIRGLLDAPSRRARLGLAARRWVLEGRTWEANARRITTLVGTLRPKAVAAD